LIVLGRVQGEVAEQFAILTQDPDVQVAHEDDDPSSFVPPAHADVVETGPVAEGEDTVALAEVRIAMQ
jgi:hypothetical protein